MLACLFSFSEQFATAGTGARSQGSSLPTSFVGFKRKLPEKNGLSGSSRDGKMVTNGQGNCRQVASNFFNVFVRHIPQSRRRAASVIESEAIECC